MSETSPVITCDGCGGDLTYTSNMIDYRLGLHNESVETAPGGGAVTATGVYPAMIGSRHFCGIGCLREWLDREWPADKGPYTGGKSGRWQRHRKPKLAEATP